MFSDRIFLEIKAVWPYSWNVPRKSQFLFEIENMDVNIIFTVFKVFFFIFRIFFSSSVWLVLSHLFNHFVKKSENFKFFVT